MIPEDGVAGLGEGAGGGAGNGEDGDWVEGCGGGCGEGRGVEEVVGSRARASRFRRVILSA